MTHFTVIKNALVPANQDARELMAKLRVSETVDIELLHFQEDAFRRYVFLVIGRVAKALGVTPEDMRTRLLVETGRCRLVELKDKMVVVVQSMHRRSFSDKDMRSFFADAKTIIIADIMPTLTVKDRDEISEMLNGGNLGAGVGSAA